MSLETFGQELRSQRELKQISLSAISEATRISEKMLEAIEAGKFSVLPQAYIRAFLRAYAGAIDLNPDEVMRRYDAVNQEIRSAAEEWVNRTKPHVLRAEQPASEPAQSPSGISLSSVIAGVTILAAVLAVIFFANRDSALPTQEPLSKVPFDKAVHESEAVTAQPEQTTPPAIQQPPPTTTPTTVRPAVDSLRLEITTTDSVWVAVLIDNVRRGEYLFPAGRTRSWAAKEQFSVSIGNAGAATFRLNGGNLGALGKRGAVARNVVITQSGIRPVQ
jgi:cytoskeletal protein RodZ